MENIHPLTDLAPRDVVARAIQDQLNRSRKVFLDVTMLPEFAKRFPTIHSLCEQANIDWDQGLIPVAPGAHFLMGGIKTNSVGETTVEGLYAIGETACTGVHGANRLASNSLLEGIVFANRLAKHLLAKPLPGGFEPSFSIQKKSKKTKADLPEKKDIKKMMSRYAGIERTAKELNALKNWLESFDFTPDQSIDVTRYSTEQIERINMLTACWLIVTSALERTESRGGHYRKDYPVANDAGWSNKHIIRAKMNHRTNQQIVTGALK